MALVQEVVDWAIVNTDNIKPNPPSPTGRTPERNNLTFQQMMGSIARWRDDIDAAIAANIGGTIADTQVAYGSGANTITGDAAFTFTSGRNLMAPVLWAQDNNPFIVIGEGDAPLDQKYWTWNAQGQDLSQAIYDDAFINVYEYFRLTRSGTGAGVQVDTIDIAAATDVTVNSKLVVNGDVHMFGTTSELLLIPAVAGDSLIGLREGLSTGFDIAYNGNTNLFTISGGNGTFTDYLTMNRSTGAATFAGTVDVTGAYLHIDFGNPFIRFSESDQAADNKAWFWGANALQFQGGLASDDFVTTTNLWMRVQRSGTTISDITFKTGAAPSSDALTLDSSQNAQFESQVVSIGTTAPHDTHLSTLDVIELGAQTVLLGATNNGGSHFMRGAYHNGTTWVHTNATEPASALSFLGTGDITLRTAAAGVADDPISWVEALRVVNNTANVNFAGYISVIQGSGGGVVFDTDLDTYIYSSIDDQLDFFVGGFYAMAIATDGTAVFYNEPVISTASPYMLYQETDAAVDNKNWLVGVNTEQFLMAAYNDAYTVGTDFMTVDRTGTNIDSIALRSDVIDMYSAAANVNVNIGRNVAERLNISVVDSDLSFTYYQDETDATPHDINFDIISTSTGTHDYNWSYNGALGMKLNKDKDLIVERNVQVKGQAWSDVVTLTQATTIAWDCNTGNSAVTTMTGNRTLGAPTNQKAGATYTLRVIQDGTGTRTLAYNAVFKWPGGTAPVLSTGAGDIDILTFVSDGTNMYGVAQLDFT